MCATSTTSRCSTTAPNDWPGGGGWPTTMCVASPAPCAACGHGRCESSKKACRSVGGPRRTRRYLALAPSAVCRRALRPGARRRLATPARRVNRGGGWNNNTRNTRSANRKREHARQPEQQPGVPSFADASTAGGAATTVAARAHGSVQVRGASLAGGTVMVHGTTAPPGLLPGARAQTAPVRAAGAGDGKRPPVVRHREKRLGCRSAVAARPSPPLRERATRLRGVRTPIRRRRR